MIVITNPGLYSNIIIMKSLPNETGIQYYKLVLKNRFSHQTIEFTTADTSTNPMYYNFVVNLLEVPFDEYEYELINSNEEEVSKGIIQIGLNNFKHYDAYDKPNEYVFYEG